MPTQNSGSRHISYRDRLSTIFPTDSGAQTDHITIIHSEDYMKSCDIVRSYPGTGPIRDATSSYRQRFKFTRSILCFVLEYFEDCIVDDKGDVSLSLVKFGDNVVLAATINEMPRQQR